MSIEEQVWSVIYQAGCEMLQNPQPEVKQVISCVIFNNSVDNRLCNNSES